MHTFSLSAVMVVLVALYGFNAVVARPDDTPPKNVNGDDEVDKQTPDHEVHHEEPETGAGGADDTPTGDAGPKPPKEVAGTLTGDEQPEKPKSDDKDEKVPPPPTA